MTNATDLFLRYREVVRGAWNLGFRVELTNGPADYRAVEIFQNAAARLFKGMVLWPLGLPARVRDPWTPGDAGSFEVRVRNDRATQLLVDRYLPTSPHHAFGSPTVSIRPGDCDLRFLEWFDWEQLGVRDFAYLKVLITRFPGHPEFEGRYALVTVGDCEVWLTEEPAEP